MQRICQHFACLFICFIIVNWQQRTVHLSLTTILLLQIISLHCNVEEKHLFMLPKCYCDLYLEHDCDLYIYITKWPSHGVCVKVFFSPWYKVCVDGFIHYECLRETLSPGLRYSNTVGLECVCVSVRWQSLHLQEKHPISLLHSAGFALIRGFYDMHILQYPSR